VANFAISMRPSGWRSAIENLSMSPCVLAACGTDPSAATLHPAGVACKLVSSAGHCPIIDTSGNPERDRDSCLRQGEVGPDQRAERFCVACPPSSIPQQRRLGFGVAGSRSLLHIQHSRLYTLEDWVLHRPVESAADSDRSPDIRKESLFTI
jgi:hypothetical protein